MVDEDYFSIQGSNRPAPLVGPLPTTSNQPTIGEPKTKVKFPDTYDQKTIGASLLPTIEDCPRRAFVRRFRGSLIPQHPYLQKSDEQLTRVYPDSVATRIGKGIHKAVEHGLKTKLAQSSTPTRTALLTTAIDTFLCGDNEVPEECEYDDGKSALWCHRNKEAAVQYLNKAIDEVVSLVDTIDPLLVEQEITAEPQWLQGWTLVVHPDVLDTRGMCRDVKTMKAGNNPSFQSQLGLQAVALSEAGYGVNGLCVDIIEKGGKTTPQTPLYSIHYPVQDSANHAVDILTDFTQRVDHYFNVDEDIRTFKANTQSNLCSRRFCPAFDTPLCPVTQQPQPQ